MGSRPLNPHRQVPSNWYETFFQGLALEVWDAMNPPEESSKELAFIEEKFELKAASAVLDVPCGSGRHAIELAARGRSVKAVDLAQEYIISARARGSNAQLNTATCGS